ncbi:MAG: hypothetical protein A2W98_13975 [Bacteroidetes bacterium GWF2_33_38]|nr:MAG: hypothetical protein A2W98_13975 [Bacteroidetes bacterium GWF2_33_38]OFY74270.1 MAG: hypothetical protein A2265_01060 [Bacteroidetes bacterium RIFOXYA12_FULL_33_9]OFY86228.1 MAG: hypothetical protein A2236_13950 [Bacteroidetes bacterium RIFOXYA2_FULL_33_7]
MSHKKIDTVKKLSNFLNIEKEILSELSKNDYIIIERNNSSTDILNNVLTVEKIEIPKKSGGFRVVYSPSSDNLTNCLKVLNSKLRKIYVPSSCVHGYIKGRGIKTNASEHLGKQYILKVDIENYFEKITKERIIKSLNNLGFQNEISSLIAKITTHNNVLVQGFHTSPTLANIIFHELDLIFSKFTNASYTRYADDLYFSSKEEIDILSKVEEQLLKFGFTINKSKIKLMKRGQKQYVTGLTVFDNKKPRISKNKKKEIRQQMHYINRYGYKGHIMHEFGISNEEYLNNDEIKENVDYKIHELKTKIKGWLLFINSIEPEFSKKYITLK